MTAEEYQQEMAKIEKQNFHNITHRKEGFEDLYEFEPLLDAEFDPLRSNEEFYLSDFSGDQESAEFSVKNYQVVKPDPDADRLRYSLLAKVFLEKLEDHHFSRFHKVIRDNHRRREGWESGSCFSFDAYVANPQIIGSEYFEYSFIMEEFLDQDFVQNPVNFEQGES